MRNVSGPSFSCCFSLIFTRGQTEQKYQFSSPALVTTNQIVSLWPMRRKLMVWQPMPVRYWARFWPTHHLKGRCFKYNYHMGLLLLQKHFFPRVKIGRKMEQIKKTHHCVWGTEPITTLLPSHWIIAMECEHFLMTIHDWRKIKVRLSRVTLNFQVFRLN